MISQIESMFGDIRQILISEIGLKGDSICYEKVRLEKASEMELKEAMIFLTSFKSVYVENLRHAYNAVPKSVWDWYKLCGTKGTWEQNNYNDYLNLLVRRWADRPYILRRDHRANPNKKKKSK